MQRVGACGRVLHPSTSGPRKYANSGYAALDIQFGNPDFGNSDATLAVGEIPGTHDADSIKKWVDQRRGLPGLRASDFLNLASFVRPSAPLPVACFYLLGRSQTSERRHRPIWR